MKLKQKKIHCVKAQTERNFVFCSFCVSTEYSLFDMSRLLM